MAHRRACISRHCQLLISIAIARKNAGICRGFRSATTLSSSLNVQLTDALRKYVDERVSDKDVYATPSEYIRDLIRQDMQDRAVALNILEGLDDLKHGRFFFQVDSRFQEQGLMPGAN
jgi:antitoxin ParD1/3/4